MDVEEMKQLVAEAQWEALEAAWLAAAEGDEPVPAQAVGEILTAVVAAEQVDRAETLGWALLEERKERLEPAERLELAKSMAVAVPTSDEFRQRTYELYAQLRGAHEHFEALIKASDLVGGAAPRRAFATLDLALRLGAGDYVANRFQNQVLCVRRYDASLNEYELEDLAGGTLTLDPRKLADEFERIDETDFRVLSRRDPQRLGELFDSDPAAVLVGICQGHGGMIDSAGLKDLLVPRYLPADAWSRWWSRARTAAKRCEKLSLTGRSPFVITYHPAGLTLEEELAAEADAAKTPLDRLDLLQRYAREARHRRVPRDAAFVAPIMEALAEQARSFAAHRPADALAASLSIDALVEAGLPAPDGAFPTADEALASADRPAELVAALPSDALWPGGLAAIGRRDDAGEQLAELLRLAPLGRLDPVARRLHESGHGQVVSDAAAKALASPVENLDLCLWLWAGSQQAIPEAGNKLEILGRLLKALLDVEKDWDVDAAVRKDVQHRIRAALSARQYAVFTEMVAEMDEAMASILKGRIEHAHGLAETVRDELLRILREGFYQLFAEKKVEPWLDEGTLWTTEAALHRGEAELKELVEVKLPANARAIGEAAAHGDLSENSEWKFAIEERNKLQARQAKMQSDLARARILHADDVPTDHVGIGSRVRVRRLADAQEIELSLLGPWDTDLPRRRYSYQTALAGNLLGKGVGETVTLKLDGREGEYRIEGLGAAEL